MARMVGRGVSNLVLGPEDRPPGASFVGIRVGPPTVSLAVSCKHKPYTHLTLLYSAPPFSFGFRFCLGLIPRTKEVGWAIKPHRRTVAPLASTGNYSTLVTFKLRAKQSCFSHVLKNVTTTSLYYPWNGDTELHNICLLFHLMLTSQFL